jgi:hypothetical protein
VALAACAPARNANPPQEATTTTPASGTERGHEHLSGSAAATQRLGASERAALGLPPAGSGGVAAGELPALTRDQWSDPEVVAARFVLVDTNYPADEDPSRVWARRAVYVSARLAEDLRTSSTGAAGLAELATQGAVFQGEVLGLATVKRDDTTAVVASSVRRSTAVAAGPLRTRVAFYRLTLVRHGDGRWLVVDVQVT